MSDCTNGGRRVYNVPTHSPSEDRLEITAHFKGDIFPRTFVINRLDREVDYVTVDGERYERVRECVNENGNDKYVNFICSQCGLHMYKPTFGRSYVDENGKRWYGTSGEHGLNYCPNCGAKVKVGA